MAGFAFPAVLIVLLILATAPVAFSQEKQAMLGCGDIKTADILSILGKMNVPPSAEVVVLRESTVKGLCETAVRVDGQLAVFYVDATKTQVLIGSLIDVQNRVNRTAETINRLKEAQRVDFSKIPLKDALIMGSPAAPKKLAVFTDPDCPFCKTLHQVLKEVSKKRKDVAIYIKLLPLPIHKEAYSKSKSMICSRSLQMLEDNFDNKPIQNKDCATTEVDDTIKLAASLGIDGTPTIVLQDGRLVLGAVSEAELLQKIDAKP